MPWLLGKKFSKKHREKISKSLKGHIGYWKNKKISDEHRRKIGLASKNRRHSEETKRKMSEFHKGQPSYNKGKLMSEEQKIKISKAHLNRWNKIGRKGKIRPYKHQSSHKYKFWRLQVFKRDNFTCMGCQKIGEYLEAHHIKSYTYYPKLRFEINNGITLCKECHKLIHKTERGKQ